MGDRTGIEWTDATWNPTLGCSRISEGCRHCYAEVQAQRIVRMAKGKPTPYDDLVKVVGGEARWTGVVRLADDRLATPLRWQRPRRIFVNSMSDLFHERLTHEAIAAVFGVMAAAQQHTFQVLTKRADLMRDWFEWAAGQPYSQGLLCARHAIDRLGQSTRDYERITTSHAWPLPNVWLGVSVESGDHRNRIDELRETAAAVRFLSIEPLIADVGELDLRGIHQVIVGCESGPGARRCDVTWLRSIRDQCAAASVAFFLKQAIDGAATRCDEGCDQIIRYRIDDAGVCAASCGCTAEGSEVCDPVGIVEGAGSNRKPGGVIGAPYLDGVQHLAFPAVTP